VEVGGGGTYARAMVESLPTQRRDAPLPQRRRLKSLSEASIVPPLHSAPWRYRKSRDDARRFSWAWLWFGAFAAMSWLWAAESGLVLSPRALVGLLPLG